MQGTTSGLWRLSTCCLVVQQVLLPAVPCCQPQRPFWRQSWMCIYWIWFSLANKNMRERASEMTHQVKELALQAWRLEFSLWNPRKGRRGLILQSCPLTPYMCCGIHAYPHTVFKKEHTRTHTTKIGSVPHWYGCVRSPGRSYKWPQVA